MRETPPSAPLPIAVYYGVVAVYYGVVAKQ